MLSSPIASETMLSLGTSSGTSCGTSEKKAEDMDKFDLIGLQANQMATAQSLKRTLQSRRVKGNIKWKNPHSSLIKGSFSSLDNMLFICNLAMKFSLLNKNATIANPISKVNIFLSITDLTLDMLLIGFVKKPLSFLHATNSLTQKRRVPSLMQVFQLMPLTVEKQGIFRQSIFAAL